MEDSMALDEASLNALLTLRKFTQWKDRDFPPGTSARVIFEYLCARGCDPRLLLSLLGLAVFNSQRQRSIFDIYGVSRSQLAKLPGRLEEISAELESVKVLLEHYFLSHFVENPNLPEEVRSRCRRQVNLYQRTPEVLRVLAIDLRTANARLVERVGPKRIDTFRHSLLDLLKYVDACTKSPHYQEVADLLNHLFLTQGKTLQIATKWLSEARPIQARKKKAAALSKLPISSDALKALYLRSAKHGFRDGGPPKSEH